MPPALTRIAHLTLLLVAAIVLVACGGDDASEGASAQSRKIDQAFARAMVPHHESAVEMAEMALDEAERPEIKRLAREIISAQESEIAQMKRAHQRIFGSPLKPNPMSHAELGLSPEEAGMDMDMAMLEDAKDFDREFIDMMIGHHRAAIRMARVELARGGDAELKKLAQSIVDAQTKEIGEMESWRMDWYGEGSPSGSAPEEGEAPSQEQMPEMQME